MQKLYQGCLNTIVNHSLPGLPLITDTIYPFYNGLSIANIPDSICHWLECPQISDRPLDSSILDALNHSFQHVILLLIDGLGLRLFDRFYQESLNTVMHQKWKPMVMDGVYVPLTSIVPSTTSSALTTLWTGKYPCEHGFIGYELFLKEFGLIANMITHRVPAFLAEPVDIRSAGFDPSKALPVITLGEHLENHRVRVNVYQHESIAFSGLSEMLLKQTHRYRFTEARDLWSTLLDNIVRERDDKTYSYIYWSSLDTLSHHTGPLSQQLYDEWLSFSNTLNHCITQIKKYKLPSSLFILCADHGQIATEIKEDFDLHNHPQLLTHLVMSPTGESRLPFIYTKQGHEGDVRNYLSTHWDDQFSMLPSQETLSSGLLGYADPHISTLDRIGDHTVFPSGNAYWWWVRKENRLLGRHGGLSRDEMLVPFYALPL